MAVQEREIAPPNFLMTHWSSYSLEEERKEELEKEDKIHCLLKSKGRERQREPCFFRVRPKGDEELAFAQGDFYAES